MESLQSKKKKDVPLEDISDFLANVLDTDFGAVLVDDVAKEYDYVAERLIRAYEEEREIALTEVKSKEPQKLKYIEPPAPAAPKYVEPPPAPVVSNKTTKTRSSGGSSQKGHTQKVYYSEKHAHFSVKHQVSKRNKHTGRADRATVDQVMDPRTRLMLFKIVNENKYFSSMYGCISTGKEANVYHAVRDEDGTDLAVKIYKTSILVFKDRNKYVEGEHRYRNGYCRKNPRKMVKMWAEKEMRNLKRLGAAGVRCPVPVLLRNHILVMTFLGKRGWAAPRLKNVILSRKAFRRVYVDLLRQMRVMYGVCGLVHADLSEYNILYHQRMPYIIDVSQSVEKDHPMASEFLRMDCRNVTTFFKRRARNLNIKHELLDASQLYRFVTMSTSDESAMKYLEQGMNGMLPHFDDFCNRTHNTNTHTKQVNWKRAMMTFS